MLELRLKTELPRVARPADRCVPKGGPRLDIVGKADLQGLPPATVITDQIDPLRSEGQALVEKLKSVGVKVDAHHFDGVTHEFVGMGKIVADGKAAEDIAVKNLKAAFAAK